jgi:hypothetical protein
MVQERAQVAFVEHPMGGHLAGEDAIEDAGWKLGCRRHRGPASRDDAEMANDSHVPLTTGLPETVLPAPPTAVAAALAEVLAGPDDKRRDGVAALAAAHPAYLDAWARLAELARDDVEAYAYARVGYHRGLDALRGAGWRGSGYVRWRAETNRGFLRSLDALRAAAAAIGETAEEERCALFLRQLDPDWDRRRA